MFTCLAKYSICCKTDILIAGAALNQASKHLHRLWYISDRINCDNKHVFSAAPSTDAKYTTLLMNRGPFRTNTEHNVSAQTLDRNDHLKTADSYLKSENQICKHKN